MADNEQDRPNVYMPPPRTEEPEVNFPLIMKIGGVVICLAVLVHVAVWIIFHQLEKNEIRHEPVLSPLVRTEQLPPEPRLQVSEPQDLRKFRAKEDAILNHYAWVNKQAGIVRVPVDVAMRVMLEQRQQQARRSEK